MKTFPGSVSFTLLLFTSLSQAITFPLRRVRSSNYEASIQKRSGRVSYNRPVLAAASSPDEISMSTFHDIIYLANITLGGNDYQVQLDTGSSDLWIKGNTSPLPNSQQTSITYNLTYGIGWAYGHVAYAPTQFAGISIPSQAYLDVSAAENPALQYGAVGIVGLGFTSLSTIDALVNHTGASTGRSLLYNAFNDNSSEPNYIAFSLQSSSDPDDDVQGTFSIGEVLPEYSAVLNSNPIPTWPESSPTRWSILLDALLVATKPVGLSSVVAGVPSGKAVALLDSGTSYTYAPPDVCSAIYGSIPGAKLDSGLGQYVVPCDTEIDIALQIGGKVYPIHPLDVTPQSLSDPGTCVGTFIPQAVAVGTGEFDWLIGDNVLRSIYSTYDFGDFDSSGTMGNPYVKLLSLVDPNKASAEFHQIRGGTAATNITYNAANSTSSPNSAPGATTVQVSNDLADHITKLGSYIPAILAIMALNALVILLLVVAAFVYMFRRRGKARPRKNPGRLSPMPMNPTSFAMPSGVEPHVYEPVSMALTEDTFVPPSPAFAKDGSKIRPMSVA